MAEFKRQVLAVTEGRDVQAGRGGTYAEMVAGMDCDLTQFRYASHCDAPIREADWVALYESTYDHNRYDGFPAIWFGRPSRHPEERKTRDRALEAHENGHPWSVVMGAL